MLSWYVTVFVLVILAELVKGLSANGTPPVLQRFSWQMSLAYFMWTNIRWIRIAGVAVLAYILWDAGPEARRAMLIATVPLGLVWYGVWWVFNRFWVGKYKFLPISQKVFATAADNKVDTALQVLGVDLGGEQKAFPVNMVFYHHQIADEIAGQPIWVTYCGLCRSGRVYDINVDGRALDFGLVGAINYNAVFRDNQTGTWWRQETGEAARGPLRGKQLEDIAFEQMTLADWLDKHPGSTVLQYDPAFAPRYGFIARLMNYEASLPGWHMQESPPLIIGVHAGGAARGYDLNQLVRHGLVNDEVGGVPLAVVADAAGKAGFVYDRTVDGEVLEFALTEDGMTDAATGSLWDRLGRCIKGKLKGKALKPVQSYQQFLRAWITFHPGTDFYRF